MAESDNKTLKREVTELLDDSQLEEASEISPPRKKRELNPPESSVATPIFTPTPTKHRHHPHHDNHNPKDSKIAVVRCISGHGLEKFQNSAEQLQCRECKQTIGSKADYFQCPDSIKDDSKQPYALCVGCWAKEKAQYTGAITLGQRVRVKVGEAWRLGSILKHWPEDDTYSIQLDGQKRGEAQCYDIYDAQWDVQLVQRNQLRPTPTRMLSVSYLCTLVFSALCALLSVTAMRLGLGDADSAALLVWLQNANHVRGASV